MSLTSRTGLTASPTKRIKRKEQVTTVQLKTIAKKAPFILKPFAGLYNPYPYGCSLLCNHPTDNEARELLKKAKNSWAAEGKNVLLAEEIEAIRAGLDQFQTPEIRVPQVESVPEELFRRYTDTDSRPLTPAPTLASAATRASGSRRCVTPDPLPTNQIREKTLLVLDLRRSHSQETLSYYGSSSLLEPPIIRIQRVPTRQTSADENISPRNKPPTPVIKIPAKKKPAVKEQTDNTAAAGEAAKKEIPPPHPQEEEDEDFMRRRGKKRRKKREGSGGAPAVQASVDPETQVAAIGSDSHNASARASLVPATPVEEALERNRGKKLGSSGIQGVSRSWEIDSFLDFEILRQLRRELNEEIIDNEFNLKRRAALEEALKTVPRDKVQCEALQDLQRELNLPPVNADLWLSLPRVFSRSNARFELPLDKRSLHEMSPLDYVKNYVFISSSLKLLYNCIFNQLKIETELEEVHPRKMSGEQLQRALDLTMGRPMTDKQKTYFQNLIGWCENDVMDFKTFCGLCAVCERLLAGEFCAVLPDRKIDPPHEIETADFQALNRKLHGQEVDKRLVEILIGIKEL